MLKCPTMESLPTGWPNWSVRGSFSLCLIQRVSSSCCENELSFFFFVRKEKQAHKSHKWDSNLSSALHVWVCCVKGLCNVVAQDRLRSVPKHLQVINRALVSCLRCLISNSENAQLARPPLLRRLFTASYLQWLLRAYGWKFQHS